MSTKPLPGWRVTVVEAKLPRPLVLEGATITRAPRTVTWTAEPHAALAPGQHQEFSLSVGPLPAPGTLALPTTQTYSDGTVVRWDEPTPASGDEPEHPAPEFTITAAAAAAGDRHSAAHSSATGATTSVGGVDPTARWLGGGALLVALVGVGLGGIAARRSGRPRAGDPR